MLTFLDSLPLATCGRSAGNDRKLNDATVPLRERGDAHRRNLTIVKLGGSHALAKDLSAWLDAIAAGAGKVVLVAGGGPFADAVRAAQPVMGFDDEAADAMALLAMEQFALALASLDPRFTVAGSRAAIRAALADKRVPVWAPRRMLARARVPKSWEVTSDSLAAWLAGTLGAARLLLIKRVAAPEGATARDLAKAGIVDAGFPTFLAASGVRAYHVGPRDREALAEALVRDMPVGRPIG